MTVMDFDSNVVQPLIRTRIRIPATLRARVVLECRVPRKIEGAGNAGCPMHPQPRVRMKKHDELVTTGSPDQARHSPRNGFNSLFRALLGVPGLLATVVPGLRV